MPTKYESLEDTDLGNKMMPVELSCGHTLKFLVNKVASHPASGAGAWEELLGQGGTECPHCHFALPVAERLKTRYPFREFKAPEKWSWLTSLDRSNM